MSYGKEIALALATPGGHLSLGRGGFTLHYGNARLSGYDCDTIKAEAIAAGLPVIDSRGLRFELAALLAVHGPMVAVNQDPSARPWRRRRSRCCGRSRRWCATFAPRVRVCAFCVRGRRLP